MSHSRERTRDLFRGCQETVRILRKPRRSITIARRRRKNDRRDRRFVTGWSTPAYMPKRFALGRACPATAVQWS